MKIFELIQTDEDLTAFTKFKNKRITVYENPYKEEIANFAGEHVRFIGFDGKFYLWDSTSLHDEIIKSAKDENTTDYKNEFIFKSLQKYKDTASIPMSDAFLGFGFVNPNGRLQFEGSNQTSFDPGQAKRLYPYVLQYFR